MTSLSPRTRRALGWVGAALAIILVLAAWAVLQTRMNRELSQLPRPARRALYERTIETLRTSCMQASGPEVTDYCRQQADFIKRFPECERDCRELAARFAPKPSR